MLASYYFAYGTNLWLEQMEHRCPSSRFIGIGRVDGWKWIINNRGFANIVLSQNDFVYGMVFEMTERDFTLLEAFDGPPFAKQELHDSSGRPVITYVDHNTDLGQPDTKYISKLYHGLGDGIMRGIPADYFAKYHYAFLSRPSSMIGFTTDDKEEHGIQEKNEVELV